MSDGTRPPKPSSFYDPPQGSQRPPPPHDVPGTSRAAAVSGRYSGMSHEASTSSGDKSANYGRALEAKGYQRLQEHVLRTRPDHVVSKIGAKGAVVALRANVWSFVTKPGTKLYQYRVDFVPEEDITRRKKYLFKQLGLHGLFDGHEFYTQSELHASELKVTTDRNEEYCITLKKIKTITANDQDRLIHIFNLLVRASMSNLKLEQIRRHYYDPGAKEDFPQFKLQVWPGYVTSVRRHEQDYLLSCDLTHKVLVTETVLSLLSARTRDSDIVGQVVMTKYNNRTYKILGVSRNLSPASTFKKGDLEVSFKQYYEQRYGIRIQYMNQPLLLAQPPKHMNVDVLCLVPELCFLTGLRDEQRRNYHLTNALAHVTRKGPQDRVDSLRRFSKRLTSDESVKQRLQELGITISPELVPFKGRELDPEVVEMKVDYKYEQSNPDWTPGLRRGLYHVVECQRWAIVCSDGEARMTNDFVGMLTNTLRSMGFGRPAMVTYSGHNGSNLLRKLEMVKRDGFMMTLVFLRNNTDSMYSSVKKLCYVDLGLPNQVVTLQTLRNPKRLGGVVTKVAAQMAAKVGSILWKVNIPLKKSFMIVGYDAWHDTETKQVVGALVATTDKNATTLTSRFLKATGEVSKNMPKAFSSCLNSYCSRNGGFPETVFFFRDGVGEGQLEEVFKVEVEQVNAAYKKLNPAGRMVFVVVSKRTNYKLFKDVQNRFSNPVSGTVVDNTITLPERYDFYLVSQSVRQGTVNPTSYNVLLDEVHLEPSTLQLLSYKMCHLYFNWSGTIKVPHVCQYAHKLAFVAGESLHQEHSRDIQDLPFFL